LKSSTPYTVTISAVSGSGATGTASSGSGTTLASLPGAPTFNASPIKNISFRSLTLNWVEPSNVGGGITGYNIYMNGSTTITYTTSSTSYPVTGLSPGTAYSFIVKAFTGGGEGPGSTSTSATTTAPVVQTYLENAAATYYPTIPAGATNLNVYVVSSSNTSGSRFSYIYGPQNGSGVDIPTVGLLSFSVQTHLYYSNPLVGPSVTFNYTWGPYYAGAACCSTVAAVPVGRCILTWS
jgi:hypothetical protein